MYWLAERNLLLCETMAFSGKMMQNMRWFLPFRIRLCLTFCTTPEFLYARVTVLNGMCVNWNFVSSPYHQQPQHTAVWLLKWDSHLLPLLLCLSLSRPASLHLILPYLPSIYHIPPFDQCQGHVQSEPPCVWMCVCECATEIMHMLSCVLCAQRGDGVCLCVCIPDWPCFDLPCSVCLWTEELCMTEAGVKAARASTW